MAGKKWCEYCRININYNRKDIENHQATRQHLQNKQKAIQFQRIKVRKQRQQKKQQQHQVMLSTANIPKAKKGSQLEQQVQAYRDSVIDQGKRAIHRMIAERTQGMCGAPIQYPEKEDLVLAENYQEDGSEDEEDFQMWKIDICEETGEPCFINRITKLVLYEPPKGYVLSEEQKEEWEYLKEICKNKVQVNPDATVNITEWQQVPDQQNYFQVNKALDSDQSSQQADNTKKAQDPLIDHKKYLVKKQQHPKIQQPTPQPKPKTFKQQLQEKLIKNEISTDEVFEKFIQHQMNNSKTVKQKNENLKKLIESGIEVRARPTDELLRENNVAETNNENKPKIGFKARKKVQISSGAVILNDEKDIF